MTERKYECYAEFWKYGIPQDMDGEVMTLREWLKNTGTYSKGFEDKSDAFVVDYMRDIMGKYLREVWR